MVPQSVDDLEHPEWLRTLVVAAVYAVSVWIGRLTQVPASGMALVWPAAGVGALWLWWSWPQRRVLAADLFTLGLLAAILNVVTGFNWSSAGWYGLMNALQSLAAAAVLRRVFPHTLHLSRLRELGGIGLAAAAGCASGVVVFAPVIHLTFDDSVWDKSLLVASWVSRNIAGAVLAIGLFSLMRARLSPRAMLEDLRRGDLIAVAVLLGLIWWWCLNDDNVLLSLLLQPLLIWVALRCSPFTLGCTVVLSSATLVVYGVLERGPLGGLSGEGQAIATQALTLLTGALALGFAVLRMELGTVTEHLSSARARMREISSALTQSEAMLAGGFDDAPLAMAVVDLPPSLKHLVAASSDPGTAETAAHLAAAPIRRVNPRTLEMFECDPTGARVDDVILADHLPHLAALVLAALGHGPRPDSADVGVYAGGGRRVMTEVRVSVVGESQVMLMFVDVTAVRRAERSLELHVLHDPLTGLANRVLFADRLDHALAASTRSQLAVGVLYLDLDGFRLVNESYGRGVADELLAQAASRITSVIRPGDTAARLNADEFALVCPEISVSGLAAVASRLHELLSRPYQLESELGLTTVLVGASIGAAVATGGGRQSGRELLRRAEVAVVAAKQEGRGRVVVDSASSSSFTPRVLPR